VSSRNTVDKCPCFVSKMKCYNNVKKHLDSCSATCSTASWLFLGQCRALIRFFPNGVLPFTLTFSDPSLHVCKGIITEASSALCESWKTRHIHVQCIPSIVLYPYYALVRSVSNSYTSSLWFWMQVQTKRLANLLSVLAVLLNHYFWYCLTAISLPVSIVLVGSGLPSRSTSQFI